MGLGTALAVSAAFGFLGGLASFIARLATPGQTFVKPPESIEVWGRWSFLPKLLSFTSDFTLGAIAGVAVYLVSSVDPNNVRVVMATSLVAGLGGAGFLLSLATKLQTDDYMANLNQYLKTQETLLDNLRQNATDLGEQVNTIVDAAADPSQPDPSPSELNQLSNQVSKIQGAVEAVPSAPPPPP